MGESGRRRRLASGVAKRSPATRFFMFRRAVGLRPGSWNMHMADAPKSPDPSPDPAQPDDVKSGTGTTGTRRSEIVKCALAANPVPDHVLDEVKRAKTFAAEIEH